MVHLQWSRWEKGLKVKKCDKMVVSYWPNKLNGSWMVVALQQAKGQPKRRSESQAGM